MNNNIIKMYMIFCISLCSVSCNFSTSFSEVVTIFSMYLKNPAQVGEIAPITAAVGDELARFVPGEGVGYVLEAGGGCGSVSERIIKVIKRVEALGRTIHLDIIEINPDMCKVLVDRFAEYDNVSIHCCSILDWNPEYKYDVIISTLPFNSLGVDFAQAVIEHFKQVASSGSMVSYVEYPIVGQLLHYFYGKDRKKMFLDVQKYMIEIREQFLKIKKTIYRNVPPINIYHLSFS